MRRITLTQRNIKIICLILVTMLLLPGATGCKRKIADKDGAALRYKFDEIEEEGLEGLFTLNKDGTFSPLPDEIPGFAGATTEADPSRFIWYTDNGENFTELIPKVTPETPIVIIYNDDSSMPDKGSWYLERYEPLGATIGAHIRLEANKTMYLSESDMLNGTSAQKAFSSKDTKSKDAEHELMEISGASVKLPIQNVDPNISMLLGLSHGKKYTFKYLQGTKTKRVNIVADTYAFQSKEIVTLSAPYQQTENGYFIINFPIGLKRGYYYISDLGFFFYDGGLADIDE